VFRERTHPFNRKLKPVADVVYASAPHLVDDPAVPASSRPTPRVPVENLRPDARTWWYYERRDSDEDISAVFRAKRRTYSGWPASRRHLAQLWATEGPFDVLCGFSQGAVAVHQLLCELEAARHHGVADALPADECAPLLAQPPRAAILVCGFPSRSQPAVLPEGALLRTPSLHVGSDADATVPSQWHRDLASCFAAPATLWHDKGHAMPQRAGDLAVVAEFVARHAAGAAPAAAEAAAAAAGTAPAAGGAGGSTASTSRASRA
jgi:hypothetical protein